MARRDFIQGAPIEDVPTGTRRPAHAVAGVERVTERSTYCDPPRARRRGIGTPERDDVLRHLTYKDWSRRRQSAHWFARGTYGKNGHGTTTDEVLHLGLGGATGGCRLGLRRGEPPADQKAV